jgi:hypothetical protein
MLDIPIDTGRTTSAASARPVGRGFWRFATVNSVVKGRNDAGSTL